MEIITNQVDGLLTIEFNRPDKKNAITAAMYQTMARVLQEAENEAAIRVILLIGKPGIFTAGNDLEDFLKHPPQGMDSPVVQFMRALSHHAKPVVAVVAGNAVGIGTTMLMHCDLVYAAEDAKFALPFASLGLCPEFASSLMLPQIAGYQRAAEKLLLGEAFSAQEAHAMGLVNRVLPADELHAFAYAQIAKLAALPPASLRITKQLMKGHQSVAIDTKMREELRLFSERLSSPEAKEAFTAFFQKRKPDFTKFS